jgi:hypothetical protein
LLVDEKTEPDRESLNGNLKPDSPFVRFSSI